MIKTKEDLKNCLQADLDRYYKRRNAKAPGLRDWFLHNEIWYIWKYIKLLRTLEYYHNNKDKSILYKLYWLYLRRKKKILNIKLGFFIPINTIGPGLRIFHLGNIMVTHNATIGSNFTLRPGCVIGNIPNSSKGAIIEDDVELSLGVKLFGKVKIGRGALINANSVVMTNIPPYAIAVGNPAKVIGFRMEPEEIVEYEKSIYPENERLDLEKLKKNYDKYYLRKLKEITKYITL